MCPGMPHAKFQSPRINIDRFFQFSAGEREKEKEKVSKLVGEGTKLKISTFAQRAKSFNYRAGSFRRIAVTHWVKRPILHPCWSFKLPKLGPFSKE